MTKTKLELREEIQKRINGIAKAENGVDKVVIIDDSGEPDFISGDESQSNDDDKVVRKSLLFGSRALYLIEEETESDSNDDAGDISEVEFILIKRSKSVFTVVANSNLSFCIVFYAKLEPRRFGLHISAVINDSPKIINLYKEMLEAY